MFFVCIFMYNFSDNLSYTCVHKAGTSYTRRYNDISNIVIIRVKLLSLIYNIPPINKML